ncbi:DUF6173 family protein [Thioclava sp. A2]|uniref:DUF6173 family protein n=1 Tax=Thioclava sp. FCG-A2 TaxID=3080562 RepID=UPI002953C20A|nr:DUF6173 family protein [Thioclava sp. A2]MDV7270510.1 DUF6173 family protein [Thioclava sp. A2]
MSEDIRTTAEAHEASALPCARVVRTADDAPDAPEVLPLPPEMSDEALEDKSEAQWAYERLIVYIQNFEEQLNADEEVAMGLVGGQAGVLQIEGLGYFAPDIITFYGINEDGARTQLIQHVSRLDVMLVANPKPQEAEAPRRIGFRLAKSLERKEGA